MTRVGWTVQSRAWRLTQMPSAAAMASALPSGDQLGPASPSSWPVAQPVHGSGVPGVPVRASGAAYHMTCVLSP